MTAPVADRPLQMLPIPGERFAMQVKSRSRDLWWRVDWGTREDGTFTTECDCEAAQFRPSEQCAHGHAVERFITATKEFQEMTQPKPNLHTVPADDDSPQNIEQAIAAIYGLVGYVQKGGKISEGPARYSYAGEADIIEALRPAMAANGVTVRVVSIRDVVHETITIGKYETKMQRTTLIATVRFAHGPSSTFVDCEALGEGMDSGDKSSNKAMTGALKYALRQTFCLETGDDPDDSRPEQQREERPQARPAARPVPEAPAATLDPATNWKLLPAVMKDNGLLRADLLPVLGGDFSPGGLASYFDTDPNHTLGTLVSAALAAKGAQ